MTPVFRCRSCGGAQAEPVIDLGLQPLANNLLRPEDLARPEPRFPLHAAVCASCWLMQLRSAVPPVELFSEYLYLTSFADSMLQHLAAAAGRYADEFRLTAENLV